MHRVRSLVRSHSTESQPHGGVCIGRDGLAGIHFTEAFDEQTVAAVKFIFRRIGHSSEVSLDGTVTNDDSEILIQLFLVGIRNECSTTACIDQKALGIHLIRKTIEVIFVFFSNRSKERRVIGWVDVVTEFGHQLYK